MYPSKKAIADYLGLDRTTVSKILNGYHREKFAQETVDRVERAAHELGYAKSQRRQHARRDLRGTVDLSIRLKDGLDAPVTTGRARIDNVSVTGLLLRDLYLDSTTIPVKPFLLDVTIREGALDGVTSRCVPVRFANQDDDETLSLGVRFLESGEATNRIRAYVES